MLRAMMASAENECDNGGSKTITAKSRGRTLRRNLSHLKKTASELASLYPNDPKSITGTGSWQKSISDSLRGKCSETRRFSW